MEWPMCVSTKGIRRIHSMYAPKTQAIYTSMANTKKCALVSHGNGDIYLQGSANNLLVYTNGTNYTHAENFRVSDLAYISSYSLGHAYFNLKGTATFQYYIWSEGNVYYSGNPGTIANLGNSDAKGQLIQRD